MTKCAPGPRDYSANSLNWIGLPIAVDSISASTSRTPCRADSCRMIFAASFSAIQATGCCGQGGPFFRGFLDISEFPPHLVTACRFGTLVGGAALLSLFGSFRDFPGTEVGFPFDSQARWVLKRTSRKAGLGFEGTIHGVHLIAERRAMVGPVVRTQRCWGGAAWAVNRTLRYRADVASPLRCW